MTIITQRDGGGAVVKRFYRCAGCGKDVVIDAEEAGLLAQATDLKCADCAGTAQADPEAGRLYEARLVLTIDGEEVAGGACRTRAGSFADASEYLGNELTRRWDGMLKAAALVDQAAPDREGDPDT